MSVAGRRRHRSARGEGASGRVYLDKVLDFVQELKVDGRDIRGHLLVIGDILELPDVIEGPLADLFVRVLE